MQQASGNEPSTSGATNEDFFWRCISSLDAQKAQPLAIGALLVAGIAASADPASAGDLSHLHGAQPIAELAEQDFWSNIARYGRYFVTVMLGTGYVMLRPLQSLFKNPVTAVLAIGAIVALVLGIRVALELMLGISEYEYNPETFRIASEY